MTVWIVGNVSDLRLFRAAYTVRGETIGVCGRSKDGTKFFTGTSRASAGDLVGERARLANLFEIHLDWPLPGDWSNDTVP